MKTLLLASSFKIFKIVFIFLPIVLQYIRMIDTFSFLLNVLIKPSFLHNAASSGAGFQTTTFI